MAKLTHSNFAEKDVLQPLKDDFTELIALTEDQTAAIQKLKKTFEGTKSITSAKDVKVLSDATAELNRQEKLLKDTNKALDSAQKKALKGLNENEKATKKLTAAKKENIDVRRKGTKSVTELRVETQTLNKQTKVLARQTLGLIKPHERLTRATDKAQKEFKDLAVTYGVTSKQAQKAERRFRTLDDQLRRVNNRARDGRRDVGRYNTAFGKLGATLSRGLGALGITAGIAGIALVLSNTIGVFSGFEKANSKLRAVLGATENQMIALEQDAEDLGATTSKTAAEVTGLQTEFAKLGFPTAEIREMTEATLRGAEAMGADLGENAKLTGSIIKIYGKEAGTAAEINDVLAAATSNSALDFEKLSSSMSTIGPVAKAFGFSLKGTVSLLGGLADAGFDASSAATATRNIMLKLADSSSELAKRLKEPVKDLPSLVKGLKQLKEEGVDLGEALELTDRRSVAAFNTFLNGTDSVLALNDALEQSVGTAERMAETQLDNLVGDITILNSAWQGFILSVESGEGSFNKTLRSIVKGTTKIIGSFTKQTTAVDKNIKSLEKQQLALFDLSAQILDTNTNDQTRQQLLEELNQLYPKVLENINLETASYEELKIALGAANDELNIRVAIQRALQGVDTATQRLATKRIELLENEADIHRDIVELFIEQGRQNELLGLNLEERIKLAKETASIFGIDGRLLAFRERALIAVAQAEAELNAERKISNETITALLSGGLKLESLSTAELRALVLNGQLTDKKLEREARFIIILRERIRNQKEINDLDDEANKIAAEEIETDLIKLKQAEIKVRKELAAATLEELLIKNRDLENLGRQLKILQEHGIEKDKEARRQTDEIDRLRILQQLRQAELRGLIELNERLLDSEDLTGEQRLQVTEELFRLRKEAIEEAAEFELSNAMLTAEERLVIAANLQNDLAALEGERVDAVRDANEAILALEKEANDKRKAENRAFFKSIENNALQNIDRAANERAKRLNDEVKAREKAVADQQQRRNNGLKDSLAFEEAQLEKARARRERELEAQRKKEEKLALFIAFLNQFQALSNEDPNTAAFKAFRNTFLAKAIADTFLGFEKGGLVEGGEQLIKINEKGKEFVLDATTTKAYGLDKKGSNMNNFHDLMTSPNNSNLVDSVQDYYNGNQWSFMQDISTSNNMDSAEIVSAINSGNKLVANQIKKYKASFKLDANGLGEMMVSIGEGATTRAVKHIIDTYHLERKR